jgi:hypothetical protein
VRALVFASALVIAGCGGPKERVAPASVGALEARGAMPQDSAPKEELRMVPPEAYLRTYLELFGGLLPLEVQARARGKDGAQLFDTWGDYFSALGFPDYRLDLPRATQTNALMVAAFERLGVALCDRAVEHDFKPGEKDKVIFAFESADDFAARFDVLHRAFLGYPAALAPTDRTKRFAELYESVVARHASPGAPKSRFSPEEAGWAAVCYGLVRHPEFHLY